jgi:hypothetical protein
MTSNPAGIPALSAPRLFTRLLPALLCMVLFSCDEEAHTIVTPAGFPGQLRLSVEYRSSYELGMRCGSADSSRPIRLRIICEPKNIAFSFTCYGTDTVVVLPRLNRATTYSITLLAKDGQATRDSLPAMQVSTLGTSSRGFRWEEIRIGHAPSLMNDVWVGSDSCIYAVGLGFGDPALGISKLGHIARWDGRQWNIENDEIPSGELWSVFGFSESDVWIASTNIYHYDGKRWTNISKKFGVYPRYYIYDIWGNRPGNVWFVGSKGSRLHWDGSELRAMHTSEHLHFRSVTGSGDSVAYAFAITESGWDGTLYRFRNGVWLHWMEVRSLDPTGGNLNGHLSHFIVGRAQLWCDETGGLLAGGRYLYRYQYGYWNMVEGLAGNALGADRPWAGFHYLAGNNAADYFMIARYGWLYHYNGEDYSILYKAFDPSASFLPAGLSSAGNTVCFGATITDPINRAVLYVGRR